MKKYIILAVIALIFMTAVGIYTANFDFQSLEYMETIIQRQLGTNDDIEAYSIISYNDHLFTNYLRKDKKSYKDVGIAFIKLDKDNKYQILEMFDEDKLITHKKGMKVYHFNKIIREDYESSDFTFVLVNQEDIHKFKRLLEDGSEEEYLIEETPYIKQLIETEEKMTQSIIFYDENGVEIE